MEAAVNESGILRPWFLKLANLFPMLCRSELDRELAEAKARIGWQKKRTERIWQRYDVLDKQCVMLSSEVDALRSKLYVAEQQAKAFKEVAKTLCTAAGTAEELKRFSEKWISPSRLTGNLSDSFI